LTEKQWKDKIVLDIQDATFHYLAVVWYIGFVGVMYQLVGLMAKEREHGMSDLVESMMPNVRRSEPQLARLIAHHLAFTIVYGPGWVIMGIIAKIGIFPKTSGGIVVIFFILNGLALVSWSIFGASFFRKSQLSGISCVVIALGLGIAAQIEAKTMTSGTIAILGLLFTPMNFVFLFIFISRWEWNVLPANLIQPAPGSPWDLRGIVLMIFLIIQIFAYPLIAVYVERWLYGTASRRSRRNVSWADGGNETPIRLNAFRKIYQQNAFLRFCSSLLGHKPSPVVAVDDLSLAALRGQILVLVGPNGCGKTTILNSIAGLNSITGGSIDIDGSNGIGICPQKNVLWNGLTVQQHAEVFYDLKTTTTSATKKEDINKLIALCGLEEKRNSPARTLSGGQKRKLQLIMMLTGGSRVCCVDEVSGGLDPLSRRRVWDILLAERGTRTFIITTHFLDEAEYLADHMVIMSRGQVKGEGSTSELKARLGNGYRFSVPPGIESLNETALVGIRSKLHAEQTFATTDPAVALEQIKRYKAEGINNYQIAGPTIEEVFMKLEGDQEDVAGVEDLPIHDDSSNNNGLSTHPEKGAVVTTADEKQHEATLLTGHRTGAIKQAFILFQKRLKVLRWNWFTYLATICIPVVAAGLMTLILKNFQNPGCDYLQQVSIADIQTLSQNLQPELVAGPPSAFNAQNLALFLPSVTGVDQTLNASTLPGALTMVNTFSEFTNFINSNFSTVDPGGIFLGGNGTVPTLSYRGDIGTLALYSAIFLQNAIDVFLSNQTIVTQYCKYQAQQFADSHHTDSNSCLRLPMAGKHV
jgi:ATP-binding cassette subfamily A (ABC1) protein 3